MANKLTKLSKGDNGGGTAERLSTPPTIAFTTAPKIKVTSLGDERASGVVVLINGVCRYFITSNQLLNISTYCGTGDNEIYAIGISDNYLTSEPSNTLIYTVSSSSEPT